MGELGALLQGLPREVRGNILSAGTTAAAKPLLAAQKQLAQRSVRTGALRESLAYKVKNYWDAGISVAVVGPDRNYYSAGQRVKSGTLIPSNAVKPANYAHLIEFGHHTVVPRKGTSLRKKTATLSKRTWVPATPFVRPSVILARGAMVSAFDDGVVNGLERAIQKIKSATK